MLKFSGLLRIEIRKNEDFSDSVYIREGRGHQARAEVILPDAGFRCSGILNKKDEPEYIEFPDSIKKRFKLAKGTEIEWGEGQLYTQMEDATWLMTCGFPPTGGD